LRDLNGRIDLVLDGGDTEVGIESTVCDLSETPVKILRRGAIPPEEITGILEHL
jgi:L-threonylcarbamoyladenylate synthase